MRAVAMVAVSLMLAGTALAANWPFQSQGPAPCQPASACQPAGPCQPVGPCQPAAPGAPPPYVVRVPEKIRLEAPPQQSPPPEAPGMFVAPPQSGRVYGEGRATIVRGLALHLPAITIGLPSLELPSIQRARDDAYMELNPARAPYVNMPSGPLRPMPAAPPLEEYRASGPSPGEAAQEPPSAGAPRACENPAAAACASGAAAAPPPPPAVPASPPAPPAPNNSSVAPRTAAPPFPTPEETARQLWELQEMERRIDAKLAYLAAMQQQLGNGAPASSPGSNPVAPSADVHAAPVSPYSGQSLIQPTALIEVSPRAEGISSSWPQQASSPRRLPAP